MKKLLWTCVVAFCATPAGAASPDSLWAQAQVQARHNMQYQLAQWRARQIFLLKSQLRREQRVQAIQQLQSQLRLLGQQAYDQRLEQGMSAEDRRLLYNQRLGRNPQPR